MTDKLDAGQVFPSLDLKLLGGEALRLPDDLGSPYAVLLFYRGHW